MRLLLIFAVALLMSSGPLCSQSNTKATARPNVLLIVCDDLNDYVGSYKGHPQALTPHLDHFAKSALRFSHAYSNNPVCAPSRASFFTGIYPHRSGNWFFQKWYTNDILKNSKTMMEHFKDHGYHVAGTGKLMHHHQRHLWSEYGQQGDYGPYWQIGKKMLAHPMVAEPFAKIGNIDGSFGSLHTALGQQGNWAYGRPWGKKMKVHSPKDRAWMPDEKTAQYGVQKIKAFKDQKEPFFLALGFMRPHTPLHAPKKYFDRFPLESIQLPEMLEGDVKDTHLHKHLPRGKGLKYRNLLKSSYPNEEGLRRFTQAYLACVAFVDDCIGQVLRELDDSPLRDNTIVVITSDHGWNMGEKDHLFKNSPWEESTRVPLIIRAPGVSRAGTTAEHPVSLIDVYPTLNDLCQLPKETRKNDQGASLDGHSLKPFLIEPTSKQWDGGDSALSVIFSESKNGKPPWHVDNQHYTIRSIDFRYIRYNSGDEELYDHRQDPGEHNNLAQNPEYQPQLVNMRQKLKAMLPTSSEHLVGRNLGSYK